MCVCVCVSWYSQYVEKPYLIHHTRTKSIIIQGVVTITINNPNKMNTMSANVNTGILQALEMCADDKTIRIVVFTGAGDRAFCAGGNLEGGGASSGFRGAK